MNGANVPAGQALHDMPPSGDDVPLGHIQHAICPGSRPVVPGGHSRHSVEPGTAAQVPAGHARQRSALGPLKVPGPQGVHDTEPGAEKVPAGQGPLQAAVVAVGRSPYVPAGHSVGCTEPAGQYAPKPHSMGLVLTEAVGQK